MFVFGVVCAVSSISHFSFLYFCTRLYDRRHDTELVALDVVSGSIGVQTLDHSDRARQAFLVFVLSGEEKGMRE